MAAKKRTPKKPTKPVMGRPKLVIDWSMVDKLLSIQCTGEEIAGVLGMSYDTIERGCKSKFKKSFADYSAEKRQGGKAALRRRQWLMAETNPTMAIFLGKQYLGQSDKISGDIVQRNIIVECE